MQDQAFNLEPPGTSLLFLFAGFPVQKSSQCKKVPIFSSAFLGHLPIADLPRSIRPKPAGIEFTTRLRPWLDGWCWPSSAMRAQRWCILSWGTRTLDCTYGSKLTHRGAAGFSPWFHLPGFLFCYLFLTHGHLARLNQTPCSFPLWVSFSFSSSQKKAVCRGS